MDSYSKRKNIILFIVFLVGFFFLIRLLQLQIFDDTYKKDATNNVLRKITEYPMRGLIYDRNGELLVFNDAVYDLMVVPREVKPFDTLEFCRILEITNVDLKDALKKAKGYSRFKPSIVVKQIPPEKLAVFHEKLYKFPGFFPQTRMVRKYPHEIAAHVLGYIGEVPQRLVDSSDYYKSGDYIGIAGIEKSYEKELRGTKGVTIQMVDVHNRSKGVYENGKFDSLAIKGLNLTSTLDWKLQEYGEKLMQNKSGSIVAIEPSTGEVLALVSSPNFSPNAFVGQARNKNYPLLERDTLKPLFNRALMAQYPPGSTFKMAVALAGLQEGALTPSSSFRCNHGYRVGNFYQGCHHSQSFNLEGAIAASCNAWFSQAFRHTIDSKKYSNIREGYEVWRNHILSLGFAQYLNTDFSEETKGSVPTANYYEKYLFKGTRWSSLSIVSLAIGQGELMITPMQMANYTAILANRGYYYIPHVIKDVENAQLDERFKKQIKTTIDPIYYEYVVKGMESVLDYGTGSQVRISNIPMCGKTGTAENAHGQDHSIFIAFAPRISPKIAIVVYVENAHWGAAYAAPIASLMIEKYINDSIQPSRKSVEEKMINTNLIYPDKPNYTIVN